jgi:hypothetical protein
LIGSLKRLGLRRRQTDQLERGRKTQRRKSVNSHPQTKHMDARARKKGSKSFFM